MHAFADRGHVTFVSKWPRGSPLCSTLSCQGHSLRNSWSSRCVYVRVHIAHRLYLYRSNVRVLFSKTVLMTRRSTSSLRPTNTCSRHVRRLQMEAPHCWRTSCCCSSHPVLMAYAKWSTLSVTLATISVSKDLDWNALHAIKFLKLPRAAVKILLACLFVEQTSLCTCVELVHASCSGVFQTEYSVSAPGVMSPQCGAVLHVLHGSGLSPLLSLCVVCTIVLALQHATNPSSIILFLLLLLLIHEVTISSLPKVVQLQQHDHMTTCYNGVCWSWWTSVTFKARSTRNLHCRIRWIRTLSPRKE